MQQGPGASIRRVLVVRGLEYGGRILWSWEWTAGEGTPRFALSSGPQRAPLLERFQSALPEALTDEERLSVRELQTRLRDAFPGLEEDVGRARMLDLVIAQRALGGALADVRREHELMAALSAELLPLELVADIRAAGAGIEVHLLPTPDCAHVPWGMLVVGDGDERLVELCHVVMLAPGAGIGHDASRRASDPTLPSLPLYVIDPDITRDRAVESVLTEEGRRSWRRRVRREERRLGLAAGVSLGHVASAETTRVWLSNQLTTAHRSHLLYVGHVTTPDAGGGATSFELNDPRECFDFAELPRSHAPRRRFTALAALAGTDRANSYLEQLRQDRGIREEFGQEMPDVPDVARSADGGIHERLGSALWPMPPRVAIIGCRSGLDASHQEPFGLVTAVLELGAESVIASRWALLADPVTYWFADVDPQLDALAHEIDGILAAGDVVSAFRDWQLARLEAWRAEAIVANSPLAFAALSLNVRAF